MRLTYCAIIVFLVLTGGDDPVAPNPAGDNRTPAQTDIYGNSLQYVIDDGDEPPYHVLSVADGSLSTGPAAVVETVHVDVYEWQPEPGAMRVLNGYLEVFTIGYRWVRVAPDADALTIVSTVERVEHGWPWWAHLIIGIVVGFVGSVIAYHFASRPYL